MRAYRRYIVAIDFDGVIVKNKWPRVGPIMKGAVKYINKIYQKADVIIFTNRTGVQATDAVIFLNSRGIEYTEFNKNVAQVVSKFRPSAFEVVKVTADIYIDDKNLWHISYWPIIYLGFLFKYKKWRDKA